MDESVKIRKLLQNIVNYVLENKKYSDFEKVEVYNVHKAPYKTAMCDITYELKIHTDSNHSIINELVKELQSDIKKHSQSIISDSICAVNVKYLN
jgi:hypothetical protein